MWAVLAALLSLPLDSICHQRDCAWSGLIWHTDLAAAQAQARAQGKPIVMLRMLGRLDEELSCANSRFFRTVLYSDPRISKELRENFVLVWTSERPVPVVTIDYGDGRVLKRTITGNSAHYLLDVDGRPLDVLPGLYAPDVFLSELRRWRELPKFDDEQLQAFYARDAIESVPQAGSRDAVAASERALSKLFLEAPLLERVQWSRRRPAGGLPPSRRQLHADVASLHPNAIALMRLKHNDDRTFATALATFRRSIAADTDLNERQLRPVIHGWLLQKRWTFEELNARIYDELFLTPASDPWLGLVADATYTGHN